MQRFFTTGTCEPYLLYYIFLVLNRLFTMFGYLYWNYEEHLYLYHFCDNVPNLLSSLNMDMVRHFVFKMQVLAVLYYRYSMRLWDHNSSELNSSSTMYKAVHEIKSSELLALNFIMDQCETGWWTSAATKQYYHVGLLAILKLRSFILINI